MTTLVEALSALERVKKQLAIERKAWEEQRADLLRQLEEERRRTSVKPNQEKVAVQIDEQAVRRALYDSLKQTFEKFEAETAAAREKWAALTPAQKTESPQGLRALAHPFIPVILDELKSRLGF